ncbi:MAG: flagellar biosynthesis protein FlhF [Nevskiales bacterium]
MKIKRFTAPDMRAAIRLVREEQGADAVILSSSRVAGGVEIIAATDYDEALMQQATRLPQPAAPAPEPQAQLSPEPEWPTPQPAPQRISEETPQPRRPQAASNPAWSQDPAISTMQKELEELRLSMESQLRSLQYDFQAPSSDHADAIRNLTFLGLEPALARAIVAAVPAETDTKHLRYQALMGLAQQIDVAETDPILQGGHFALIGPTGVGKTTTIAKLAAHYAMHRSARDVALVTTDRYRVGAQEQIFIYGRMLGVPVHVLEPKQSLSELLTRLADYRLVLIDTAGMSPRDPRLAEQLAAINLGGSIKNYLVMPASGQAQDLDETANQFSDVPLSGCILTKLDETSRLGGALSVAIRRKLNIDYVCDGQRVPEDLHRTKPNKLVMRAMRAVGPRQLHSRPVSVDPIDPIDPANSNDPFNTQPEPRHAHA